MGMFKTNECLDCKKKFRLSQISVLTADLQFKLFKCFFVGNSSLINFIFAKQMWNTWIKLKKITKTSNK